MSKVPFPVVYMYMYVIDKLVYMSESHLTVLFFCPFSNLNVKLTFARQIERQTSI